jgi:hypothetical protein
MTEPIRVLTLLFQSSPDWLSDAVRPVLVTQAVLGTIALIGLVAVLKRFLQHEFPAAMQSVNNRLDTLHDDFKSLENEFRRSLLEVERLKERVESIRQRQDNMDETLGRRRSPRT